MTAAEVHVDYPAHWEADVLLQDGRAARIRPALPDDVPLFLAFYERVSAESKYMRFLSPRPALTQRDLDRFTRVDHDTQVVFFVTLGGHIIGTGSYDRVGQQEAEVAFLVEDSQHGRGVGALLLEHLAQAGRERGLHRFVAEVLPENGRMIRTFRAAGYHVAVGFAQGLMRFEFPIQPTETSLTVMRDREHRAEARSMERFFVAHTVAVIGASRRPATIGWRLVSNLVVGGFTGRIYVVNPSADAVLGMPAYPTVRDVPDRVDLAIVAVPAEAVQAVVQDCAAKGVHGLVVISSGFGDAGAVGRQRQEALLEVVRASGMRLVGPNCLGVINTAEESALNASLSPVMPPRGRVGFFCQSGALGVAILQNVAARGLGLSTFVSAGNRADVSGNDLLQYWEEDQATEVVLLYLESTGNPRKFSRIARRVGRAKPIVAVKSGGTAQGVPLGHTVRSTLAPRAAVESMFRQAGVIQVDTLDEMFDVAQLLAHQPVPAGPRVAVVSNSDALLLLALDAVLAEGLTVAESRLLGAEAGGPDFEAALHEALGAAGVDAVVAVFTPPLDRRGDDVAEVLAAVAQRSTKPLVTTFLAFHGVPEALRVPDGHGTAGRGSVPSYPSPEAAVRALAYAVQYGAWLTRPASSVPEFSGLEPDSAAALVRQLLAARPDGLDLGDSDLSRLLGHYGIALTPTHRVSSEQQALAALAHLGGPVILKATDPGLRRQPFLDHERRDISDAAGMHQAWQALASVTADPAAAGFVVQRMGPVGLPVTVVAREDPSFGPIVAFGMSGPSYDLLQDISYRIPPLTTADVAEMVREVKAAPLFFGYSGSQELAVAEIETLIHRVAQLKDALPDLERLELGAIVGAEQLTVLRATARLAPPTVVRADWNTRHLPGLPPADSLAVDDRVNDRSVPAGRQRGLPRRLRSQPPGRRAPW